MDKNKEIYLPDTTIKYEVLKTKLKNVYGLDVISNTEKYLYLGLLGLLFILIIKNK